jgi:hypothetical protein
MINWLNDTYRWFWKDLLKMANPFTWYFRKYSKLEPVGFWFPVSILAFMTLMLLITVIVALLAFVRPFCQKPYPLWKKVLLCIGWGTVAIWIVGGMGFMIWFIFHIGVGC